MSAIGQLIITGIDGPTLNDEERRFICDENIGGVILFTRNYESPQQLASLVSSIQELQSDQPLYIAVDQEGGRVVRFKTDFVQPPPMYNLAKIASTDEAEKLAAIMAKELLSCGVNLDFTPVCDVWTNPDNEVIGDRAFGHEPDVVSNYSSAVIRGMQSNGVMACAKHFPGHGNTLEDSHYDLPVVDKQLDELRKLEFAPFARAVGEKVEFVMMAHMIVKGLDPEHPCTLSPIAHTILREELSFAGIIISDDMEMHAITKNYSIGEASVMALNAGSDIVEFRSMATAREALDAIKSAFNSKILGNKRVDECLEHVFESKNRYLSTYSPSSLDAIGQTVGSPENVAYLNSILERS